MKLSRHLKIETAPKLRIDIESSTTTNIIVDDNILPGNSFTLSILDTFSSGQTLDQGLHRLRSRYHSAESWIELTRHISFLYSQGALQPVHEQKPRLKSHSARFDASPVHIRMLNDYQRMTSYRQAIFRNISSRDVVVDIGTGTGVLAVMAAQAGARHVYAIEQSDLAIQARKLFAQNGLADRITLIKGKSTNIELPERADTMISEIIGNDPLQENILPTTRDAVKRLLKPNARLIPLRLRIYGAAISVPNEIYQKHIFTREKATEWQQLYNIDFSTLVTATHEQPHHFLQNTRKVRKWPRLSPPWLVANLDLGNWPGNDISSVQAVTFNQPGVFNGILIYFELDLDSTTTLSIHPDRVTTTNHWESKVWIPGETRTMKAGEKLEFKYTYRDNASNFIVT